MLFSEGSLCLEAGDFTGAQARFRKALRLAPGLPETHLNLGVALEKAGAMGQAEACYSRTVALDPGCLQGHLNLGALLVQQKRFREAGAAYDRMLEAHPAAPAAWSNLGYLQACLQQEAEAEHSCRQALALDPGYAKARYNLSYLLLHQGRYEEGWAALEARPWSLDLTARIPAPRWQGEDLQGRSLLIGSEGGYGDMIHFCRYVPLLKERGAARIGIVCRPELKRLLTTLSGIDAVVALGEAVPAGWDCWTLPLSLPHHCGTRADSIPSQVPYLQADPDLGRAWRARLPAGRLRVGLAWQGNPRYQDDADRSLHHLEPLAPLARPDVHFISLQKGPGQADAAQPPPGMDLFDPSPWIEDFTDSAALVAQLDLVISIDTATAHLAGALGIPCWLLLADYKSDWRWLKDREDSPWYPATRLFRQRSAGAWEPVIAEVARALEERVRT